MHRQHHIAIGAIPGDEPQLRLPIHQHRRPTQVARRQGGQVAADHLLRHVTATLTKVLRVIAQQGQLAQGTGGQDRARAQSQATVQERGTGLTGGAIPTAGRALPTDAKTTGAIRWAIAVGGAGEGHAHAAQTTAGGLATGGGKRTHGARAATTLHAALRQAAVAIGHAWDVTDAHPLGSTVIAARAAGVRGAGHRTIRRLVAGDRQEEAEQDDDSGCHHGAPAPDFGANPAPSISQSCCKPPTSTPMGWTSMGKANAWPNRSLSGRSKLNG